jgi:DNA polymerase-3 subunit gamma/tau
VSPFAADSARKGAPKAESSGGTSATSANLVIMGSAAPAVEELSPAPDPQPADLPKAAAEMKANVRTEATAKARPEANAESLRDAVLQALASQQMLASLLENAEWRLEGNALTAKVAASKTMIEMSFTADARRIAGAAASGLAGRPIKMLVEPGGAPQAASPSLRSSSKSTGTARSRAEQDPIVQRMQEKFGAEIRTVIDYREKG